MFVLIAGGSIISLRWCFGISGVAVYSVFYLVAVLFLCFLDLGVRGVINWF